MGRRANNKVWEYFDYISDELSKCRVCSANISVSKGSRGNMVRHLFKLHGVNMYNKGPKVLKTNATDKEIEKTQYLRGSSSRRSDAEEDDVPLQKFKQEFLVDRNTTNASPDSIRFCQKNEYKHIRTVNKIDANGHLTDVSNGNQSADDPLLECHLDTVESLPQMPANIHSSDLKISKKVNTDALAEKLKAETRYFNELSDLVHSKRIYVDLQCQKLRLELSAINKTPT